ncbi:hypothetical protein O181_100006 [Austropuccinia psidii MF-1]|uniref:Uncharacterized protein n=1 Tax=Austropuccinia psidii MF-1 TaxID=1389203 RepID=A0A9Q3JDY1_9BASI|nr:hypothetical protein [Austropuccinia psidii MF-1]
MLVMLANKHTRNSHLFSNPSDHAARGVPPQNTLARTPLWLTMMKAFPSRNGCRDPKQADRNAFGQLAPFPQVSICPCPLQGHHPMVTLLLDQREVIIQPIKDGNEQNPPNPPQQDSPVPCMPCKQTPRQPTPGLTGTQWSEDLFHGMQPHFPFLILTFSSSELTLPPFVEPSQHNEPPIPGLSKPSEPHEDFSTCGPEPDVAPMQSMEETFG